MNDGASAALPPGSSFVRATPEFDADSVPGGLLRAHRIAEGVWGVLVVSAGTVNYVLEASDSAVSLSAGDRQVIAPGVLHHVEPSPDARFFVEFHRGA